MTLLTKFAVTEELLNQREHLHELVDMLWRNGGLRRSELYEAMRVRLNERNPVHISDMYPSHIREVAKMFDAYVQHRYAACSTCKHAAGTTDIGLVRCGLTGHPFCYHYKQSEQPITPCVNHVKK